MNERSVHPTMTAGRRHSAVGGRSRVPVLLALPMIVAAAINGDSPWTPLNCSVTHCNGQTIHSDLGLLRFCLPRFGVKVTKEFGEHGDMHHSLRVRHRGRPYILRLALGPYFTGRDPSGGHRSWSRRVWQCGQLRGDDYVLRRDGTITRYITLNALMGAQRCESFRSDS